MTIDYEKGMRLNLYEMMEGSAGSAHIATSPFTKELDIDIPPCTSDVLNSNIPSIDISIEGEDVENYAMLGLSEYEVKDSNNNRINCWPVCIFTMNGQVTLRLRMMCAGQTAKHAASISGIVSLRHR